MKVKDHKQIVDILYKEWDLGKTASKAKGKTCAWIYWFEILSEAEEVITENTSIPFKTEVTYAYNDLYLVSQEDKKESNPLSTSLTSSKITYSCFSGSKVPFFSLYTQMPFVKKWTITFSSVINICSPP